MIRQSGTDELNLCLTLRYLSHDLTLRRPALRGTSSNIFGVPIEEVCQREKRSIPHIVTCCVREIERRGLDELGIYRVSGLATDIAKLRKVFDTRNEKFIIFILLKILNNLLIALFQVVWNLSPYSVMWM